MALRWKKDPKPTGLMRVGAGPRGSSLTDNGVLYATVKTKSEGAFSYNVTGWYWVAGYDGGIPTYNSSHELLGTEEEAKSAAMAYVREHLQASNK